jgi:hypothetical protein
VVSAIGVYLLDWHAESGFELRLWLGARRRRRGIGAAVSSAVRARARWKVCHGVTGLVAGDVRSRARGCKEGVPGLGVGIERRGVRRLDLGEGDIRQDWRTVTDGSRSEGWDERVSW